MRSRAYPSNDLATAVRRLGLYNTNLGVVGYHTREEIAVAIGYKGMSGPASRAMASLVHYGLLEKRKDKYGISELGKSVLLPQVDGETESAIKEAAIKPNLFNELAHQYQGQELPSLLGNILTSPQYGISPKVKDEVVEVFKATMEYAGLLRNNRVQPLDPIHDVADSMTNEQLPSERGGGEGELRNNRGFNSRNVDGGLTPLPSGISIAFPPSLGFAVITGEFGAEIKALEKKAQALLKDEDNGTGPDEEKSEREL